MPLKRPFPLTFPLTETQIKVLLDRLGIGGTGTSGGLKNNFDSTVVPTPDDDVSEGYTTGSIWVDTASLGAYILLDSTNGSAIWASMASASSLLSDLLLETGDALLLEEGDRLLLQQTA